MMKVPFPHKVCTLLLCIAALSAGASTPAAARTPFDGIWNVVFLTYEGPCDRSYRYGVRILNGRVVHDPSAAFAMIGRVAANGAIRGSIRASGESASAAGRLSRGYGAGTWHAPSRGCAGRWQARRVGGPF
jgi:hypothetical protein